MKADIQSRGLELTEKLKVQIERKLQFAFHQLEPQISAISICISKLEGGVGMNCRLRISILSMEDIVIEDTQSTAYVAIDRAMKRASRSVARKIALLQKQKNI